MESLEFRRFPFLPNTHKGTGQGYHLSVLNRKWIFLAGNRRSMSPSGWDVPWAAITGELNRNHQWRGRPKKGTPAKRDLCSESPGLHIGIEVDRDMKQDPGLPQTQEMEYQDKPGRANVLSLE